MQQLEVLAQMLTKGAQRPEQGAVPLDAIQARGLAREVRFDPVHDRPDRGVFFLDLAVLAEGVLVDVQDLSTVPAASDMRNTLDGVFGVQNRGIRPP